MRLSVPTPAPSGWLRLPPRTARLRLTLLYGGLFLLLGTALLALTFLLFRSSSPVEVQVGPVNAAISRFVPRTGVALNTLPRKLPAQSRNARLYEKVGPGPPGGPGFSQVRGPVVATIAGVQRHVQPLEKAVLSHIRGKVIAQQNADIGRLLEYSWLGLALTALVSAGLGWVAAGRVLRPLRAITTTARTISAGNLHQRLALTGAEDEFKQLGDTLDDLLARLEGSFEAQRRFVANASHELRTPLTLERTLLQVALADPNASAQTLRSTCEELLTSQAEHARLLEALLTLASSERGLEHSEPLDLSALTKRALQVPRPEIQRRELAVETELAPAPMTGEPALIQRLISNLIDNAVEHNRSGGRLVVRTESRAGQAIFAVSNTGQHIPADQTQRLFEPFQQLNGNRTTTNGHHGLGLSIVRAIATAHEATLTAAAQPEGGLAVTVGFPAASTPGAPDGPVAPIARA